ncbi:hypothetical protein RZO50_03820 [Microbacterium sp. SSW1-59]|uniref:hypothetical protein n=1 Tax=Microbacterium xanthum TaxID=3079794 RepID=UPI002AD21A53|nr:hypothetical protein [Microbacterium sp. SSW1-59]MDZ8200625.1 hypothetical protein [Microbacterium sp. SSW1-59]
MSKRTPLGVQNDLKSSIDSFHARAKAIKDSYYEQRKAIFDDTRLSAEAQNEDAAKLLDGTVAQLATLKGEQDSYVQNLKDSLERDLRGNQPTDANSVLLRRDAAQRARQLGDEREALAALQDAVRNDDVSLQHAIGYVGRQQVWVNVGEAYRAAQPATADIAEALSFVDEATSDVGYRLGNQMTYSSPSA